MIRRISGSVPAAREHQFESNAVSAVSVKVSLVGQEVAKMRAFRGCGVIKTVKSEGSLSKKRLSVVGGHVPVGLWDVRDRVGEVTLIDISLFFETIRNTYAFVGVDGQFVIANGDPTGTCTFSYQIPITNRV